MKNVFKRNCCDGVYNSFDVHFTSLCDNKCAHCIDTCYSGTGISRPDSGAIARTIIENKEGYDDVLFLGGEPCLFLEELVSCIKEIKDNTNLKVYVTTSVPKTCYDKYGLFMVLLDLVDGINLSVQHHEEIVADVIRGTISKFDRQKFYEELPLKKKFRINLNIVKPYLYTHRDILECLDHYSSLGFLEIKLSEIQHGTDYFVSFEEVFPEVKLSSPFYGGCQQFIKIPGFPLDARVLLKRSCFMCEETLKASFMDGVKALYKVIMPSSKNKYGVIYEDGSLKKGWI